MRPITNDSDNIPDQSRLRLGDMRREIRNRISKDPTLSQKEIKRLMEILYKKSRDKDVPEIYSLLTTIPPIIQEILS